MEQVGQIMFDGHTLDVYDSLDKPYFLAQDVAKLIEYSSDKTGQMLATIEKDEYLTDMQYRSGQKRKVYMVSELGLYNVLSQSQKPIARKWRRVVHSNLILLRKQRNMTIEGQFEEWNAMLEDLFIDPDTGVLMQIRTIAGGDVDIVPYVEEN